jgi:hypothetical protein
VESGRWKSCAIVMEEKRCLGGWSRGFVSGDVPVLLAAIRKVQALGIVAVAGLGCMVPTSDGSHHLRREEPQSKRGKSEITMQVRTVTEEGTRTTYESQRHSNCRTGD